MVAPDTTGNGITMSATNTAILLKAFCASSVSTAVQNIHLKSIIPSLSFYFHVSLFSQLGPNIKELFRLVEDFVDVIGLRMKDFQDMYEVTDNLGQPYLHPGHLHSYLKAYQNKYCYHSFPFSQDRSS